MSYSRLPSSVFAIFLKRFITPRVYTVCTRTKYKIVPVTNMNKYLHHSTSRTE
jgi:hypothetical protein